MRASACFASLTAMTSIPRRRRFAAPIHFVLSSDSQLVTSDT